VNVSPAALAFLLLVPLLTGVAVVRGLGVRAREDRLAFLGWAWVAGTLVLSTALFAWSWFALPAPCAATIAFCAACACAAEVVARLRVRRVPVAPEVVAAAPRRGRRIETALFWAALVLALTVTLDRIVTADASIVCTGDEVLIWAAKAKALWVSGGMSPGFERLLADHRVVHADYPPHNPLLQWWTWLVAGRMGDVENRLAIQLFAPALLLVAAAALRRHVGPALAGALLVLLTLNRGMTHASWPADADGLVACGFLVAVDGWLRFAESGRAPFFALSSFGLATALWAKNEGALLAVQFGLALGVAAVVSRRVRARLAGLRGALAWLLLPVALEAAHRAFNLRFGLVNDLAEGAGGSLAGRMLGRLDGASLEVLGRAFARSLTVPPMIPEYFKPLVPAWLGPSDQNLLLPVFFALALLRPRRAFGAELGVVTGTLFAAVASFALVYLGTVHDLAWHLDTSVGRVLFDLVPAATVASSALLGDLLQSAKGGAASSAGAAPSNGAAAPVTAPARREAAAATSAAIFRA